MHFASHGCTCSPQVYLDDTSPVVGVTLHVSLLQTLLKAPSSGQSASLVTRGAHRAGVGPDGEPGAQNIISALGMANWALGRCWFIPGMSISSADSCFLFEEAMSYA